MEKTPIKKQSPKQKDELTLRRLLKWQLFNEQERKCAKCGRFLWWDDNHKEAVNYPHLSHKDHIKMGGCRDKTKTTSENCEILCAKCHSNEEHNLRNIYGEMPQFGK